MDNQRHLRLFSHRSDTDILDARLDARKVEALGNELRALPELVPPSELWADVRERLDSAIDDPPARKHPGRVAPLALAAGVVLFALATVLVSVDLGDIEPATRDNVALGDTIVPTAQADDPNHTIEALMARSRLVEEQRRAVLAFYSTSGPEQVLRVQIGGIDAALNDQILGGEIEPAYRETLLRDRVDLLADLTDIERYRQHEFVRQVSF